MKAYTCSCYFAFSCSSFSRFLLLGIKKKYLIFYKKNANLLNLFVCNYLQKYIYIYIKNKGELQISCCALTCEALHFVYSYFSLLADKMTNRLLHVIETLKCDVCCSIDANVSLKINVNSVNNIDTLHLFVFVSESPGQIHTRVIECISPLGNSLKHLHSLWI